MLKPTIVRNVETLLIETPGLRLTQRCNSVSIEPLERGALVTWFDLFRGREKNLYFDPKKVGAMLLVGKVHAEDLGFRVAVHVDHAVPFIGPFDVTVLPAEGQTLAIIDPEDASQTAKSLAAHQVCAAAMRQLIAISPTPKDTEMFQESLARMEARISALQKKLGSRA